MAEDDAGWDLNELLLAQVWDAFASQESVRLPIPQSLAGEVSSAAKERSGRRRQGIPVETSTPAGIVSLVAAALQNMDDLVGDTMFVDVDLSLLGLIFLTKADVDELDQ